MSDNNTLVRINKYLSEVGVCSRREADRYILQKRITVNGEIAVPGQKVAESDIICIDGREIKKSSKEVFLIFNKPRGLVCTTARKENGKKIKNVVDYINYPERIYPVGRLDKDSEGLLILTNQGEYLNKILKSRYGHEKEYIVELDNAISDVDIKKLENGIHIVDEEKDIDVVTKPCKVARLSDKSINITITQGINRQIRRMCASLGYRVLKLKRVRIINIRLGDLKTGEYRVMSEAEVLELKKRV
ncbi:MAG: rRNA pseudouridine synthase [Lachnospiraceae bacterium]|nr:rRNA pseudouridine synthase [Lachnospiraceae bacterium]